jgi:hypothetical protein
MKLSKFIPLLATLLIACSPEEKVFIPNDVILEYTPTLLTKKEAFEFRLQKIKEEKNLFEKLYREIQSPNARENTYFKLRELEKEEEKLKNQLYNILNTAEENAVKKHDSLLPVNDEYLNDKSLQSEKVSYPFYKPNGEPILYPNINKFDVVNEFKNVPKLKRHFDEKNVWRVYLKYPQVLDCKTPAGWKYYCAVQSAASHLSTYIPSEEFLMELAKELYDAYGIKDLETMHYKHGYQRPDHVLKWNRNTL